MYITFPTLLHYNFKPTRTPGSKAFKIYVTIVECIGIEVQRENRGRILSVSALIALYIRYYSDLYLAFPLYFEYYGDLDLMYEFEIGGGSSF